MRKAWFFSISAFHSNLHHATTERLRRAFDPWAAKNIDSLAGGSSKGLLMHRSAERLGDALARLMLLDGQARK
jgi:hypothetical protein